MYFALYRIILPAVIYDPFIRNYIDTRLDKTATATARSFPHYAVMLDACLAQSGVKL